MVVTEAGMVVVCRKRNMRECCGEILLLTVGVVVVLQQLVVGQVVIIACQAGQVGWVSEQVATTAGHEGEAVRVQGLAQVRDRPARVIRLL